MDFSSDDHASDVLTCLYAQQQKGEFTDFTVNCGSSCSIQCHRNVLATNSPYFEALFQSPLAQCKKDVKEQEETIVDDIQPRALEAVIQYIYTGKIRIDTDNLADILHASDMLLIADTKKFCEEFMISKMVASNCLVFSEMANKYNLDAVLAKAKHMVETKFTKVVMTEDFLEVSAAELKDIIGNKQLKVENENSVLECSLRWINHNKAERASHLMDLLSKYVQLKKCTSHFLLQMRVQYPEILMPAECQCLLLDAMCSSQLFPDKATDSERDCYGGFKVVLIGGATDKDKQMKNNLCWFSSDMKEDWKKKFGIPTGYCTTSSSVCRHGDGLIITGGNDSALSNMCKMFYISTNSWEDRACLSCPRHFHASVDVLGVVYVFGGHDGKKALGSVERYSEVTGKWTTMSPMLHAMTVPVIAAVQTSVYVIADSNSYNAKVTAKYGEVVQCYDTINDFWGTVTPLPFRCTGGWVAITLDNGFYVCGGEKNICAKYSPDTDKWTELTPPNVKHVFGAGVVQKDKILLIGGVKSFASDQDCYDEQENSIEAYDPALDKWEIMKLKLPEGLQFPHAFFMQIPKS